MVFLAYIHILLKLTHVARSSHIAHILPTNIYLIGILYVPFPRMIFICKRYP